MSGQKKNTTRSTKKTLPTSPSEESLEVLQKKAKDLEDIVERYAALQKELIALQKEMITFGDRLRIQDTLNTIIREQ